MKKSNMKIKKSGIVYQVAICVQCGWQWDNPKTARARGYAHANRVGHKVHWETGTSGSYN